MVTALQAAVNVEPLWRSRYVDPHLKFTIEVDLGQTHILLQLYAGVSANGTTTDSAFLGNLYLNPDTEHEVCCIGKRRLEMLLPLTRYAIERIEERRMKDRYHDVHLKVQGHMNVLFADIAPFDRETTRIWELTRTRSESIVICKFEKSLEIPASKWTDEYLDRLGLGKHVSIDIPIDLEEVLKKTEVAPERPLAERITSSAKILLDAQKQMNVGNWEEAVGHVRRALEPLEKETIEYRGESISMSQAIKRLFTDNGYPPKVGDAVKILIDNLYEFTNPAHHVQISGTQQLKIKVPFDKEDAQYTIGTVTLLLNTLAKKLIKKAIT